MARFEGKSVDEMTDRLIKTIEEAIKSTCSLLSKDEKMQEDYKGRACTSKNLIPKEV